MNLKEDFNSQLTISEKKSDGSVTVVAPFAVADQRNGNNRIYPASILKREINRLNGLLASGNSVFSGAYHNSELKTNDVSHLITNLRYDEKSKTGFAKIKILPTSKGKDVMVILNHGGRLGLSMSGNGSTKKEDAGEVIQNDYMLRRIDVVLSPSFGNAVFNSSNIVSESLDYSKLEEARKNSKGLTEAQIYGRYKAALLAGFKGSVDNFKEKIVNSGKR